MKVVADNMNGIVEVENFDDYTPDQIVSEKMFHRMLRELADSELLCCELSDENVEFFDTAYGIRRRSLV